MENRRSAARHKTYKAGTIFTPGQLLTIACLVRNVSDSGARIEVDGAHAVPTRFQLLIDGQRRDCAVAWKSAGHIGVRFI